MRECRHESSVGILESLRRGDSVQVKAHGFSMWPSYRDGVVVEVFPCDLGHVRIGDVVLVKVSERILLHRVVGRCGKGIVTKGDARPVEVTVLFLRRGYLAGLHGGARTAFSGTFPVCSALLCGYFRISIDSFLTGSRGRSSI